MNVLEIGLLIDVLAPFMPQPTQLPTPWAQFLLVVGLAGFGTAAFISAGFGTSPRDGLMMALKRQYGSLIGRISTRLEAGILLMQPSVGTGLPLFRNPNS